MEIAILAFPGMTLLDAVGPAEILSSVPGATVRWHAKQPGIVRDEHGVGLEVPLGLDPQDAPAVLLVPGGAGTKRLMRDMEVLHWLRAANERTRFTTSVGTGSLVLGAAGLLRQIDATTHWLARARLAATGASVVDERVVERGKFITAAGVTAGIDMALLLVEKLANREAAQAAQLLAEYDPRPHLRAGSPDTAPPSLVTELRERTMHLGEDEAAVV